ncbi:MAG: 50S ribosomal protein L28 [Candidatus Omnitrophota bacterium]|nr:50S ribosomal protein L28 [Candidatus Omnitrophota bacterium]
MANACYICGKKPVSGRSISRRGMAKSKGGVGQRITGKTLRRFIPNIQSVKALIDGKTKRIKACTKCIKAGNVKKAVKKTV